MCSCECHYGANVPNVVCGACRFECPSIEGMNEHMEAEHGQKPISSLHENGLDSKDPLENICRGCYVDKDNCVCPSKEQLDLRRQIEDIIVDTTLHPTDASLRILALFKAHTTNTIAKLESMKLSEVETISNYERTFNAGIDQSIAVIKGGL